MDAYKIGVFVGSLRKASWSRKVAHKLMEIAPASLAMEIIEIGNLPLYNQDYDDSNTPETYKPFREQIKECHAVLFVTPEYNRSIPGVLKNALDVGSRPYGQSVWNNKAGAVLSISLGAVGGFGANHHLRQCLTTLNVPCLPTEAYIGNVAALFDANDQIVNKGTQEFFEKFMASYAKWVANF